MFYYYGTQNQIKIDVASHVWKKLYVYHVGFPAILAYRKHRVFSIDGPDAQSAAFRRREAQKVHSRAGGDGKDLCQGISTTSSNYNKQTGSYRKSWVLLFFFVCVSGCIASEQLAGELSGAAETRNISFLCRDQCSVRQHPGDCSFPAHVPAKSGRSFGCRAAFRHNRSTLSVQSKLLFFSPPVVCSFL